MLRRITVVSLGLMVVLLLTSCAPLAPPVVPPDQGALEREALPGPEGVPASWGKLVSVSTMSTWPDLVQLWFEDSQGTTRMVVLRLGTNQYLNAARLRRS